MWYIGNVHNASLTARFLPFSTYNTSSTLTLSSFMVIFILYGVFLGLTLDYLFPDNKSECYHHRPPATL